MEKTLIEALYLTLENAKNLNEEARILKDENKYGRSYTLYHLSFEECGRFFIIFNLLVEYYSKEITIKELNYKTLKKRGYEDHDKKIEEIIKGIYIVNHLFIPNQIKPFYFLDKLVNGSDNLLYDKFFLENLIKDLIDNKEEFNRLKNVGLYVTFSENKFHLPDDKIMLGPFLKIQKLSETSILIVEKIINSIKKSGGFENFKKS